MSLHPERWIAAKFGLDPVAQEIVKQLIDQPLHLAMSIVLLFLFGGPLLLFEVPAQLAGMIGAGWTFAGEALREWSQWPPGLWRDGPMRRWWDPPLDWLVQLAGIWLGFRLFVAIAP